MVDPDSTAARTADRAVVGAQIALGFAVASFGPYLTSLADELDRPQGELVWVTSMFGAGLLLTAVLGSVVLRAGAGTVLRLSCLGTAVGAGTMSAAAALPAAGAGSALVGLGCAVVVLVTPVLLRGRDAARRLTRAVAGASAAGIVAPPIFGLLEYAGLPGRLALLAPVPVLLMVAARRTAPVPAAPGERGERPAFGAAATAWLRIVLAVGCEFCFVVWGVARLVDSGASLATASVLSTGFVIGMAVGRLVGPRFAEHPRAVAAAAATAMAGTAVVFAGDGPATVALGITVASLGISLLYPVTLAQLVSVPGLSAGHSASIGSLASGTAILAAPALLGRLEAAVDLRAAFLLPIPILLVLLALRPEAARGAGAG